MKCREEYLWCREECLKAKLTPPPSQTCPLSPRAHDGGLASPIAFSGCRVLPKKLTKRDDECAKGNSNCSDSNIGVHGRLAAHGEELNGMGIREGDGAYRGIMMYIYTQWVCVNKDNVFRTLLSLRPPPPPSLLLQ